MVEFKKKAPVPDGIPAKEFWENARGKEGLH